MKKYKSKIVVQTLYRETYLSNLFPENFRTHRAFRLLKVIRGTLKFSADGTDRKEKRNFLEKNVTKGELWGNSGHVRRIIIFHEVPVLYRFPRLFDFYVATARGTRNRR